MNVFDGLNVGEVTFEPGNIVYSMDLPDDDPRKAILDDMGELLGVPVSLVDKMPTPEKVIDVMALAKVEAARLVHRPHYKIKKRLASICRQTAAIRLMAIEAIADDEPRAYALEFLKQIEDYAGSAYRVIEADRQKIIKASLEGDR